jgi:hypothetical protein
LALNVYRLPILQSYPTRRQHAIALSRANDYEISLLVVEAVSDELKVTE